MKNLTVAAIAMLLLLNAATALALTVSGQVKRIYPFNDKVLFQLKSDTCNTSATKYYQITLGSSYGESSYKLLLASALAGKSISVAVNNCDFSAGNKEISYLYQDY